MTSALFKKKFPLTSIPLFLGKKINKKRRKRKKKEERKNYNPKFSKQNKGNFKERHGQFLCVGLVQWFFPFFVYKGSQAWFQGWKIKGHIVQPDSGFLQEISSFPVGQLTASFLALPVPKHAARPVKLSRGRFLPKHCSALETRCTMEMLLSN